MPALGPLKLLWAVVVTMSHNSIWYVLFKPCTLKENLLMPRTTKCNLIKHGQVCYQSLPAIKGVYLYVISFTHTQAHSFFLWAKKWREMLTYKYLIEIILWS
jgi:hypothetical protein